MPVWGRLGWLDGPNTRHGESAYFRLGGACGKSCEDPVAGQCAVEVSISSRQKEDSAMLVLCCVAGCVAGHVITNYHVITDASDIQVTFMGGAEYAAKVIGVDPDKDVAVLQVCDNWSGLVWDNSVFCGWKMVLRSREPAACSMLLLCFSTPCATYTLPCEIPRVLPTCLLFCYLLLG